MYINNKLYKLKIDHIIQSYIPMAQNHKLMQVSYNGYTKNHKATSSTIKKVLFAWY